MRCVAEFGRPIRTLWTDHRRSSGLHKKTPLNCDLAPKDRCGEEAVERRFSSVPRLIEGCPDLSCITHGLESQAF